MSNNIKNYLGIAGIIAILALAYGVHSIAGTLRYSSPAMNSISVTGEGKIVAIPDIAQFSYSVISEGGTDIAKLQKDNTEKGNAINKMLKDNGVKDADIKTSSYNITPRYKTFNCYGGYITTDTARPCPPSEIVGYTVSQSVSVKARDFSKVSELLGGVATLGANNVSGLSFTVEEPDELQSMAKAEAIEKARAKAEAMAKAGGFRLGRLLGVDEGGRDSYMKYDYSSIMTMAAGVAESYPAPIVEAGSEDITASVTLRYEIR